MSEKKKTIMAVGAHIGDAQLTCGMVLAKHAMQGDKIVVVDLTAGERGTPLGLTPEEFRPKNVAAAKEFATMLGGESVVFDIPDGELVHDKEICVKLARVMREYQVDAVMYHWQNSLHEDHEAAHKITKDAIFYASLPTFPIDDLSPAPIRRTLYAENWEDPTGFTPYVYIDVTEAFPLWKDAVCKLWLTEHSRDFKYLQYYDALSRARGALIRKERASAFAVDEYAKKLVWESL